MTSGEEIYRTYQWRYEKDDFKFCPRCGAQFDRRDLHIEGEPQLVCHSCEFILYLDPKVVVTAVVHNKGRILLLQRAEDPGAGKWGLPGGHVERGQSPLEAIRQEVWTEASVKFEVAGILDFLDLPDQQGIQIIFHGHGDADGITANIESHQAHYFCLDELPSTSQLAFPSTGIAIEKYQKLVHGS